MCIRDSLYVTGLLPKVIFESWKWIDERFALHRYISLAKREYYSVVYTLLPATGRTMPQSHTERYNVKAVWYWYPFYSLGGLSFFAYIVLTITGIYLGFYYVPDGEFIEDPDTGEMTSGAYQSMELIMTKVTFGYIIRAVHHWSAHFMVASVFLHMMRVYFVGAYILSNIYMLFCLPFILEQNKENARLIFKTSIYYFPLLLTLIVADLRV